MKALWRPRSLVDGLDDDTARRLVATLFEQRISMLAPPTLCVSFALLAYAITAAPGYLAAAIYVSAIGCWCFAQATAFRRLPARHDPSAWAKRSLASAWATAAGWGGMTLIVFFEQRITLVAIYLGIHAGLTCSAAIRNNAVPTIAYGQIWIASVPLFVGCIAAGGADMHLYAYAVAALLAAMLAMSKFLHRRTLRIMRDPAMGDPLANLLNRSMLDLPPSLVPRRKPAPVMPAEL